MIGLSSPTVSWRGFTLTWGEGLEFELLNRKWRYRITPVRCVLALLVLVAVGVMIYRLVFGLGAATNLNDDWPWGWWIAFDDLSGVALAAGGYTTALVAYILNRRRFRSIARAALITSMLGYIIVLLSLLMEIGRWYNWWRPFLVYPGSWQSILFQVFWCVACYTVVQVLEFGYIFSKEVNYPRLERILDRAFPSLLIVGVTLATLHQAVLGSVYVPMVDRLDPLWWSLLLPVFFWTSSLFVGPAMCVLEGALAGKAYRHRLEVPLLARLVRLSAAAMTVYLVLRLADLAYRGHLADLFSGSTASYLCLVELGVGVLVPLVLFALPGTRTRPGTLVPASALTVGGVILNRFNVVFTGMAKALDGWYFPSWMELAITVGLVSLVVLAYCFIVENFAIFGEGHSERLEETVSLPRGTTVSA